MKKQIILLIILLICISCASSSIQNKAVSRPSSMDPQWTVCKTNRDCIKVKSFCRLPATVNRQYKDIFLDFVKQNKDSINCTRYQNVKYDQITEALCQDRQCRLVIP